MANRDIIAIGASNGGIEALKELASALPQEFPASVFVVQHLGAGSPGLLGQILARETPLPTFAPKDGASIEPGRIYVAPPDRHMLLERGRVRIVRGPKENRHRPAIDPLFRSAAWAYGPRVIGVVLTGELDDGTAGLWAIKTCGGVSVVQDPDDAIAQSMPRNALAYNDVDHCVALSELGALLTRLVAEELPVGEARGVPDTVKTEVEFAAMNGHMEDMGKLGAVSSFTCPTCRGALWELTSEGLLRYRCHTGHAFGPDSMLAEQSVAVENALYSALRVVEEKSAVLRRLGAGALPNASFALSDYRDRATDLDATARVLRGLLSGDRS